jgi:hypothetical protein
LPCNSAGHTTISHLLGEQSEKGLNVNAIRIINVPEFQVEFRSPTSDNSESLPGQVKGVKGRAQNATRSHYSKWNRVDSVRF